MSKLYFRYGAMNSGKSTHLMQVAHNYEERGMEVIIIKPSTDKKGGDKVVLDCLKTFIYRNFRISYLKMYKFLMLNIYIIIISHKI